MLPCVWSSLTAALRVSSCTVMSCLPGTIHALLYRLRVYSCSGASNCLHCWCSYGTPCSYGFAWLTFSGSLPAYFHTDTSHLIAQVSARLLHMLSPAPPRPSTSAHAYTFMLQVGESEAGQQPATLPFPAAEHPADIISQGIDSATQLSTTLFPSGTTPGSAEGAAVPLGMEGWGEGHMPGVYGGAEGAAGNGNIGQQPAAAEPADSAQTDTPVTREYTINGKRK